MRVRRRAAGLVLGSLLLFLVGTNVQSGWLLVLSSMVLGALLAGIALPLLAVRGVSVVRQAPVEAFVGDDVPVDLRVTNRGRRPKLSILVRDAHIAPVSAFVPWLAAGETVTASTERRATRRGVVDGGAPVQVRSSGPFGVAEARRSVPASGRTVIYPRVVPVGSFSLLEPGREAGEDVARTAARGDGHDFLAVREYMRGDSLRRVHWPSTARHGTLIVREFERERQASVVVVVDTWADASGGDEEETALDLCCSVAASVALEAVRSGRLVALAAASDAEMPPPLPVDRTEALTWLAELTAPGGLSFPAAVEAIAPVVRPPSACLLVFPTWRPNAARPLLRAVADLAQRGVAMAAAIVDAAPLEPAVPVLAGGEVEELASGLAREGVDVYRIGPREDLAACLARSPSAVG